MRGPLIAAGGAGLGLRRPLLEALLEAPGPAPDFLEIAPENWIGVGGRFGRGLRRAAERWPLWLHGLSLDIGGPRPLDGELLEGIQALRRQLARGGALPPYSEHLSYCADHGHLYDLLPIPFTAEAARYVAGRVREVQDRLGERIALENSSYYAAPGRELTELEFIAAVAAEADCDLLLDVNNLYVNSVNHGYDALAFLRGLPLARVRYIHVAGHDDGREWGRTGRGKADGIEGAAADGAPLLIDTHGAPVMAPVWELLEAAYRLCGPLPTLLERDFNLPPLPELLDEVAVIAALQAAMRREAG